MTNTPRIKKKYRKKVKRKSKSTVWHESDLTDQEWLKIKDLFPKKKARSRGRKRKHDLRAVMNGLRYLLRTGCQWEYIPKYYPPWSVCRYYFDKWKRDGTLEKINFRLCEEIRVKNGRHESPTAAVIDSQSKRTTEAGGDRGFDGGKKVNGRKRFILVDTLGNIWAVLVAAADMSDKSGGKKLLEVALERLKTIRKIWTDNGFKGLKGWLSSKFNVDLEVIKREDGQKGFVVLPRRWVVERSFAWLCDYRRLMVDYEQDMASSVGMILLASISRSLRNLCHTS